MSKIAEQKAHQFLMKEHTSFLNKLLHEADLHVEFQYHKDIENSYANGYDQAMQDFLEKAEKFFNEELYVSVSDQICSMNEFKTMKDFVNYFKNYMQNE